MVDGEEAAAGEAGDDVVAQIGLLQAGEQDDPVVAALGVPEHLTNPEDRVGPDDLGLAELELHLAGTEPGCGDVQADGDRLVVPLPFLLDDRPQLLRAQGSHAHCGSSSSVHSMVSRWRGLPSSFRDSSSEVVAHSAEVMRLP